MSRIGRYPCPLNAGLGQSLHQSEPVRSQIVRSALKTFWLNRSLHLSHRRPAGPVHSRLVGCLLSAPGGPGDPCCGAIAGLENHITGLHELQGDRRIDRKRSPINPQRGHSGLVRKPARPAAHILVTFSAITCPRRAGPSRSQLTVTTRSSDPQRGTASPSRSAGTRPSFAPAPRFRVAPPSVWNKSGWHRRA